ncbi:hypothetical protein D1007_18248 [Hordeum vulgare]|nr:hypothetical protein D1007_18248 [Hordeum vulgare]
MNSNPNHFPKGIGWRAFFLGCSLSDRTKFKNTMEVYSNFTRTNDKHKGEHIMVKKATVEELKTMIDDLVKGAMTLVAPKVITLESEEEAEVEEVVVRAPEAGHRTMLIKQDDIEDDETMHDMVQSKDNNKGMQARRSKHLHGHRG